MNFIEEMVRGTKKLKEVGATGKSGSLNTWQIGFWYKEIHDTCYADYNQLISPMESFIFFDN